MPTSQDILYSAGKNDECKTPSYGVLPIIPYIPKDAIVWCPFDMVVVSNYVTELVRAGITVVPTHIQTGQDFHTYEPDFEWDVMISNPPFTNKRQIFERAISFGKPFALLMTMVWLNDAAPVEIFANTPFEMMMFDKRILFECNGVVNKKITFKSGYYCSNFLPQQIVLEKLDAQAIKEQKKQCKTIPKRKPYTKIGP